MELRVWWKRDKQAGKRPSSEEVGTIGCMATDPEQLPSLFRLVAERTPTWTWGVKRSPAAEALLSLAVAPHTLSADGALTDPRSFGVYDLESPPAGVMRYRFGNHPVRMRELIAEHPQVRLLATFLNRHDAQALARLLREEQT